LKTNIAIYFSKVYLSENDCYNNRCYSINITTQGGTILLLDDSIGFLINYTGRRLSQLLTARLSPYGITPEQWSVLSRLCEQDGMSQKELALRVGKDQTNVTRILDQLERKSLATRRTNPEDRRSFCACVTAEGRTLQHTLAPIEEELIAAISIGLTEDQLTMLKQLLLKLVDNANKCKQQEEISCSLEEANFSE
jgi:DNA-binding MarR family transcriptional regulator